MQSWARGITSGIDPAARPDHAVAAQAVAEEHGLVASIHVHGGRALPVAGRSSRLADVVQALGQELDVDLVDRPGYDLRTPRGTGFRRR